MNKKKIAILLPIIGIFILFIGGVCGFFISQKTAKISTSLSYDNNTILIPTNTEISSDPIIVKNNKNKDVSFQDGIIHSISPALPATMVFNELTGEITGITNGYSSLTEYEITTTYKSLKTTMQIILAVESSIIITSSMLDIHGTINNPIDSSKILHSESMITVDDNNQVVPATYSISPELPSGLSINSKTGIISGVSNVRVTNSSYSIIATFRTLSARTPPFNIEIIDGISITAESQPPSIICAIYTPVTTYSPLVTCGSNGKIIDDPVYSISPNLPKGLDFDSTTGIISGIPVVGLPRKIYYITSTYGSLQTTIYTWINIVTSISITPAEPIYSTIGSPIQTQQLIVYDNDHNDVSHYATYTTIPEKLPSGLNINSKTGVISGVSTTGVHHFSCIIVASYLKNTLFAQTSSFNIEIITSINVDNSQIHDIRAKQNKPVFSPWTNINVYDDDNNIVNRSLTFYSLPNLPNVYDDDAIVNKNLTFSISPELPDGLELDSASGAIFGFAPQYPFKKTYIITATYGSLSANTIPFTIEIISR